MGWLEALDDDRHLLVPDSQGRGGGEGKREEAFVPLFFYYSLHLWAFCRLSFYLFFVNVMHPQKEIFQVFFNKTQLNVNKNLRYGKIKIKIKCSWRLFLC